MFNMPFCAYCVQMATTFLESETEAFSALSSLMCDLMNSTARYAPGRNGLRGGARKPIDHRAAGDQAQQKRRVEDREIGIMHWRFSPFGERHDDREDHGGGAHHRGADQHRLGGRLEGVAGAVVLFQVLLGLLEIRLEAEIRA